MKASSDGEQAIHQISELSAHHKTHQMLTDPVLMLFHFLLEQVPRDKIDQHPNKYIFIEKQIRYILIRCKEAFRTRKGLRLSYSNVFFACDSI